MRLLALVTVVLLAGCHNALRLASPQLQMGPPELTCIVVVQSDDGDIAKAAVAACRDVVERERRRLLR